MEYIKNENFIIGVDPGIQSTAWSIFDIKSEQSIATGLIKTKAKTKDNERIFEIFSGISETIKKYRPSEMALEIVFVKNNPMSIIKVGMVRGAIMLAATINGLEVFEYTPTQIKKSISGKGIARKASMKNAVEMIMRMDKQNQITCSNSSSLVASKLQGQLNNICEALQDHNIVDAISIAWCHASEKRFKKFYIY